jgi:hypothetical protein
MRPRWRHPGRPSRAGSAARRPRRNAPSNQTAPVPPDLNFPHTQQVVVVQRHTTDLTGSNARTELVYALSSQPATARCPGPRPLAGRSAPLGPRRHLHRRHQPHPHRLRPPGHGHPTQPRDRAAPPRRSHPDRPTLRWVNRNPARALAFLGLPVNPLTLKSDHAEVLDAPGTGIPISHQRHAMGTLFDLREHQMAETCGPVRGSRGGVTKEREPSQPRARK